MTPGAGFLKRTVENRLGAGAPDAGLDAALLLVGLDDRIEVGRLRRRIDGDLALSLRAFDEALGAIRPSYNARSAVVAPVAAGAEPDPQLAANMASATIATATRWCLRIASTLVRLKPDTTHGPLTDTFNQRFRLPRWRQIRELGSVRLFHP